jgi:hypothetical protein
MCEAGASTLFEDYTEVVVATTDSTGSTLGGMTQGVNAGNHSGKNEGQVKLLANTGPGTLWINHEDSGSTGTAQFSLPNATQIAIPVSETRMFITRSSAWTLIGSPVSMLSVNANFLPRGIAPASGTVTNTFGQSAISDNLTQVNFGPFSALDTTSGSGSDGTYFVGVIPTGAGVTTPPAYNFDVNDARSIATGSTTTAIINIISQADATRSSGTGTLQNIAYYADANNGSGSTNYAWESQHGSEYHGLGVQSSFIYYNTQDFEESGKLGVQLNLTVGASAFGGTAVWRMVAATGHELVLAGGTPVLSSCGSGSPTVTGTDAAGFFTTGGTVTTCTLTFATTYTNRPSCVVSAEGTATEPTFTVSATAITFTVDVASTTYDYRCTGMPTST